MHRIGMPAAQSLAHLDGLSTLGPGLEDALIQIACSKRHIPESNVWWRSGPPYNAPVAPCPNEKLRRHYRNDSTAVLALAL